MEWILGIGCLAFLFVLYKPNIERMIYNIKDWIKKGNKENDI